MPSVRGITRSTGPVKSMRVNAQKYNAGRGQRTAEAARNKQITGRNGRSRSGRNPTITGDPFRPYDPDLYD
jgi:hypothetical protein